RSACHPYFHRQGRSARPKLPPVRPHQLPQEQSWRSGGTGAGAWLSGGTIAPSVRKRRLRFPEDRGAQLSEVRQDEEWFTTRSLPNVRPNPVDAGGAHLATEGRRQERDPSVATGQQGAHAA